MQSLSLRDLVRRNQEAETRLDAVLAQMKWIAQIRAADVDISDLEQVQLDAAEREAITASQTMREDLGVLAALIRAEEERLENNRKRGRRAGKQRTKQESQGAVREFLDLCALYPRRRKHHLAAIAEKYDIKPKTLQNWVSKLRRTIFPGR